MDACSTRRELLSQSTEGGDRVVGCVVPRPRTFIGSGHFRRRTVGRSVSTCVDHVTAALGLSTFRF